jgi:hypothetical protein
LLLITYQAATAVAVVCAPPCPSLDALPIRQLLRTRGCLAMRAASRVGAKFLSSDIQDYFDHNYSPTQRARRSCASTLSAFNRKHRANQGIASTRRI